MSCSSLRKGFQALVFRASCDKVLASSVGMLDAREESEVRIFPELPERCCPSRLAKALMLASSVSDFKVRSFLVDISFSNFALNQA